jgi:pimeloyl-ACP methyl ester carboxylesterase
VAGLAYVVGFIGYGATEGASQYLAAEADHASCETPGSRFGWDYEAVNYAQADDAALLAANPDPTDCASQGAKAGEDVKTEDGVQLAGWYIPAAPVDPTAPTIVIVHGGKSNKSGMLSYAPAFHDGFNVLIVDLRNSGRSTGTESTGGVLEQEDLKAMLDWLDRTKDPSWIGVMGNSNGAATALAEALDDERVKALILDSMHASVETQLGNVIETEHGLPAWPAAWGIVKGVSIHIGKPLDSVDPVRSIAHLIERPILLTHGLDDVLDRPLDSLDRNVAAAERAGLDYEVHTCAGAGHGHVVDVCGADWAVWVRDFLERVMSA